MKWDSVPKVATTDDVVTKQGLQEELKRALSKHGVTPEILKAELEQFAKTIMTGALNQSLTDLKEAMKEDFQKALKDQLGGPTQSHETQHSEKRSSKLVKAGFSAGTFGMFTSNKSKSLDSGPEFGSSNRNSATGMWPSRRRSIAAENAQYTEFDNEVVNALTRNRVPSREGTANTQPSTSTPGIVGPQSRQPSQPLSDVDEERLALLEVRKVNTIVQESFLQSRVRSIVQHSWFEPVFGFILMINALVLGIETNCQATGAHPHMPAIVHASEPVFCVIFVFELSLRMFAYRASYFYMEDYEWNIIDLILVGLQVIYQLCSMLKSIQSHVDVGAMRTLRLLRLIRITRAFRVLRLFEALRTIVSSMAYSLGSLFWSILILIVTMYIFGILFMQIAINATGDITRFPELTHWFGNVGRTILTMFECVVGGVSWDRVLEPLIKNVSPWMGAMFVLYIAIFLFGLLNIVTVTFVERVTTSVREDKDMELGNRIWSLFSADGEEITWKVFRRKLQTKTMIDFFQQIDVDPSQAKELFSFLDADGSGSVDTQEMILGFLKLRGPAKALQVMLLASWISDLKEHMLAHSVFVESRLSMICHKIGTGENISSTELQSPQTAGYLQMSAPLPPTPELPD